MVISNSVTHFYKLIFDVVMFNLTNSQIIKFLPT